MFSVIFDMDGTLVDSQRYYVDAWENCGRVQGIEGLGKILPDVSGMNIIGWTAYLNEHYPTLDTDRFNKEVPEYVISNLKVSFKPGAKELLEYLKSRGVKIALASGSLLHEIDYYLTELSAKHYFDAVVGGDSVKNSKPAPDVFLKSAELMGVNPEDCIVFEDSKNGILAAHNANMKCIGVPDIAPFDEQTKAILFKELKSLDQAIEILNNF